VHLSARLDLNRRETDREARSNSDKATQKESLVIAEDFSVFFLFAILLIIPAFIMISARNGGSALPGSKECRIDPLNFKNCPKCAEQLPLSTLVCDACDYNFLSGSSQSRYRLLPAPDADRLSA
jgi:hypothetical protein